MQRKRRKLGWGRAVGGAAASKALWFPPEESEVSGWWPFLTGWAVAGPGDSLFPPGLGGALCSGCGCRTPQPGFPVPQRTRFPLVTFTLCWWAVLAGCWGPRGTTQPEVLLPTLLQPPLSVRRVSLGPLPSLGDPGSFTCCCQSLWPQKPSLGSLREPRLAGDGRGCLSDLTGLPGARAQSQVPV